MNHECGNCSCDQGRYCPGEPMIKTSRGAAWLAIAISIAGWVGIACLGMAIRSCTP